MSLSYVPKRHSGGFLAFAAILLLIAAASLFAMMAWHVLRLDSRQMHVTPRPGIAVDASAAAARLSTAVQLPTVWTEGDDNGAAFEALHRHLKSSFPHAHALLQREAVGRHALLYTWRGTNPRAAPIALLAHQDVVPITPGSQKSWQAPPFSGAIKDGYVWGRGTWDDKGNLMSILESVEALARSGFRPQQTIYLSFGDDEEAGGRGAQAIAALLRSRGVKLRFVLDEGMLITNGIVADVSKPVALIGIAEKGYLTLKLTAQGQAGHSSMPPSRRAVGVLGEAVARIEAHQMPSRLEGVPLLTLEAVAPEVAGMKRWLLSNLWLTGPLIRSQLEKSPSSNAMIRTTGVATVFHAGDRDSVLPATASACINFRLLPGDSIEAVQAHVKQVLRGLDVTVERMPESTEPPAVSNADSLAFKLVARTLRELQPDLIVAPGLLIGATDSRHFKGLAENTFRFSPVHATSADLPRFHGTNERISVGNYAQMIQFYERLLRNASEEVLASR